MTAKIKSITEECNITLTYNIENAFRYSRQETAKKWMRMADTPRLVKAMCRHRSNAHHYNSPDEGYCYLIARTKLTDWRMKESELHYFYGLYEAGGVNAIDEFFGNKPTESTTNDQ